MRKNMYSLLCMAVLMVGMVACKKEDKGDDKKTPSIENEITDTRDGKKYTTVTIGNQTWLASNLKYITAKSLCPSGDCDTYGVYYTAADAKTACMAGFHLPSDQEWKTLEMNQGMLAVDTGLTTFRGEAEKVGQKLKENGSAGLDLRYSGSYSSGIGDQVGLFGYFWTSTESTSNSTETYFRAVKKDSDGMRRGLYPNNEVEPSYFCIRCIKD